VTILIVNQINGY